MVPDDYFPSKFVQNILNFAQSKHSKCPYDVAARVIALSALCGAERNKTHFPAFNFFIIHRFVPRRLSTTIVQIDSSSQIIDTTKKRKTLILSNLCYHTEEAVFAGFPLVIINFLSFCNL